MRRGFLAIERQTTRLALVSACLLLAFVSLLGLWQVVARFVLEQPSTWTEEAMRRLLIWAVMLGVVAAFREGALVSVDLMLRLSRGRFRAFVRALIAVVSLVFLAVVLWFGIDLSWRVRFQTFASLDFIRMSWGYAAVPVGAALAMLAVIGQWLEPRSTELDSAR